MLTKDLSEQTNHLALAQEVDRLTCGFSATYFAHCRISRIASIDVSGKEALQANSDKHFTASWKLSRIEGNCRSKTVAKRESMIVSVSRALHWLMMWVHVWKANPTIWGSVSAAAIWKTLKIFFQPDRMFFAWESTKCVTHRTTMSRMVVDLQARASMHLSSKSRKKSYEFFFMIISKGLRNSFWKRKFGNSPFSRNFIDNCRRESTAKKATSCNGLQAT